MASEDNQLPLATNQGLDDHEVTSNQGLPDGNELLRQDLLAMQTAMAEQSSSNDQDSPSGHQDSPSAAQNTPRWLQDSPPAVHNTPSGHQDHQPAVHNTPSGQNTDNDKGSAKKPWMNGFIMFSKHHRKTLAASNRDMKISQISVLIGKAWKELSAERRSLYDDMARMEHDQIKTDKTSGKTAENVVQQSSDSVPKVSPSQAPLSPSHAPLPSQAPLSLSQAPLLSGFSVFGAERRRLVRYLPQDVTDRLITQVWQTMTSEQRQAYEVQASRIRDNQASSENSGTDVTKVVNAVDEVRVKTEPGVIKSTVGELRLITEPWELGVIDSMGSDKNMCEETSGTDAAIHCCTECDQCFMDELELDHHLLTQHMEDSSPKITDENSLSDSAKTNSPPRSSRTRSPSKPQLNVSDKNSSLPIMKLRQKVGSRRKVFQAVSNVNWAELKASLLKQEKRKVIGANGKIVAHRCPFCPSTFSLLSKKLCPFCASTFGFLSNLICHLDLHAGKQWMCDVCHKAFRSNANLKTHQKFHGDYSARRHVCAVCGQRFPVASNLRRHMLKHSGQLSYRCNDCPVGFRTLTAMRNHCDRRGHTQQTYTCDQCASVFYIQGAYDSHVQTCVGSLDPVDSLHTTEDVRESRKNVLNCSMSSVDAKDSDLCTTDDSSPRKRKSVRKSNGTPSGGSKLNNVIQRLKNKNNSKQAKSPNGKTHSRYKCPACRLTFQSVTEVIDHVDRQHPEPELEENCAWPCGVCSKTFRVRVHWKRHMNYHTDEEQDTDKEKTEQWSPSSKNTDISLTDKHQDKMDTCSTEADEEICKEKRNTDASKVCVKNNTRSKRPSLNFTCEHCSVSYKRRGRFRKHLAKCRGNTDSAKSSGNLKAKTIQTFSKESKSLKHPPLSVKWPCDKCGKKFSSRQSLSTHSYSHLDYKMRLFACRFCGLKFTTLSRAKSHLCSERKHNGLGFTKRTPRVSSDSYFVIPTGQKLWACETCKFVFRIKQRLQRHLESHLVKKPSPYKCRECGKGCRFPSHLKSHNITHFERKKSSIITNIDKTQSDEKEKYKCDHCSVLFNGQEKLASHVEFCKMKVSPGNESAKLNSSSDSAKLNSPTSSPQTRTISKSQENLKSGNGKKVSPGNDSAKLNSSTSSSRTRTISKSQENGKSGNGKKVICTVSYKEGGDTISQFRALDHQKLQLKYILNGTKAPVKTKNLSFTVNKTGRKCKVQTEKSAKPEKKTKELGSKVKRRRRTKAEKALECPKCERVFRFRCELKTHLETLHFDLREHECGFCQKKFHLIGGLKNHLKIHLRRIPECPLCGAEFKWPRQIKAHLAREGECQENRLKRAQEDEEDLRKMGATLSNPRRATIVSPLLPNKARPAVSTKPRPAAPATAPPLVQNMSATLTGALGGRHHLHIVLNEEQTKAGNQAGNSAPNRLPINVSSLFPNPLDPAAAMTDPEALQYRFNQPSLSGYGLPGLPNNADQLFVEDIIPSANGETVIVVKPDVDMEQFNNMAYNYTHQNTQVVDNMPQKKKRGRKPKNPIRIENINTSNIPVNPPPALEIGNVIQVKQENESDNMVYYSGIRGGIVVKSEPDEGELDGNHLQINVVGQLQQNDSVSAPNSVYVENRSITNSGTSCENTVNSGGFVTSSDSSFSGVNIKQEPTDDVVCEQNNVVIETGDEMNHTQEATPDKMAGPDSKQEQPIITKKRGRKPKVNPDMIMYMDRFNRQWNGPSVGGFTENKPEKKKRGRKPKIRIIDDIEGDVGTDIPALADGEGHVPDFPLKMTNSDLINSHIKNVHSAMHSFQLNKAKNTPGNVPTSVKSSVIECNQKEKSNLNTNNTPTSGKKRGRKKKVRESDEIEVNNVTSGSEEKPNGKSNSSSCDTNNDPSEQPVSEIELNSSLSDTKYLKIPPSMKFTSPSLESSSSDTPPPGSGKSNRRNRPIYPKNRDAARYKCVDGTFQCPVCDKKFTHTGNFNAHYNLHTQVKTYKCEMCGKFCRSHSNLKSHMKFHLDGDALPHKCRFCGKGFHVGSNCRVHERTHTKERPYVCDYCAKAFQHNNTRKSHMLKCGKRGEGD